MKRKEILFGKSNVELVSLHITSTATHTVDISQCFWT